MHSLTFTEYSKIIDDDYRHIEFLSRDITNIPLEKYICRLIYGMDSDVLDIKEIIDRVDVFIGDKELVTKVVKEFTKEPKVGFVRINGTYNLMTGNGLIVTWNYRLTDVMLCKYTGSILFKITSEAPDNINAFKNLGDIKELHNTYVIMSIGLDDITIEDD